MMAGNPNWWSMNNGMHLQSHEFVYGSTSPLSSSSNPSPPDPHHPHTNGQDFPVRSWSQLLLGGLANNEEERYGANLFQHQKKLENWEEQVLNLNSSPSFTTYVRQEVSHSRAPISQFHGGGHLEDHEFQARNYKLSNLYNHHHHQVPVSSPTSCITTLSNNLLNFSGGKSKNQTHNQDHSSECNSTGTGGASKKARVTQSSAQPALKVRKAKLGDRIIALHEFVSPFGKTDTASVLSETIGCIRFLEGQIQVLSTQYMGNASGSTRHPQHSVQERNCLFPDEGGQFLNDVGMESKGASKLQDLRSRGLCLVPISCTEHVGNENGADHWAPATIGGGF